MSEKSKLDLMELCAGFAQACDPKAGQAPVISATYDPAAPGL